MPRFPAFLSASLLLALALAAAASCSSTVSNGAFDASTDLANAFRVLPDAGADAADATACGAFPCTPGPVDASAFVPHPTPAHACSATALDALVNACFGPDESYDACAAAQQQYLPCTRCLYTPTTDEAWGPLLLVMPPGAPYIYMPTPYFGGCVAAVDKRPIGQKCAVDIQELQECEIASCLSRCEVDGSADVPGENALFGSLGTNALSGGCYQAADQSTCGALYTSLNQDCVSSVMDGPASFCFNPATEELIEELFGAYCGGADAG
jgi:hypothetical protein